MTKFKYRRSSTEWKIKPVQLQLQETAQVEKRNLIIYTEIVRIIPESSMEKCWKLLSSSLLPINTWEILLFLKYHFIARYDAY